MMLLVQIVGVLVLGGLVGLLLRGESGHQAALGVTALAVAVTGLAFWNGAWPTTHTFVEQSNSYPSIHEANIAPGSLFPANEPLLEATELALPRSARIYLICESNSVGCSGEWISYQLSPRLLVGNISEAQYVLVYGDSPTTVPVTMHLPIVVNRADGGVVRAKPA
jgi:hypothetical protein